jgi:hypothetical protein
MAETRLRVLDDDIKDGNCLFYLEELDISCVDLHKIKEDGGNCIVYLEELDISCVDLHKIKEEDDGNCVISKANNGEADYTHEKALKANGEVDYTQLITEADYTREQAWKANGEVDYTQLTSFLEVDNSFLSPWRWNPRPSDDGDYEDEDKEVRGSGRARQFILRVSVKFF